MTSRPVVSKPSAPGTKKVGGTCGLRSVTVMPTTRRPGKAMRMPTGSLAGAT
ncbi:hypothetical protein RVN83_11005 [Streptomyces sp. PU10]|uniref:hypothetical protein n=1 Tax=Streptomyces sp. PU10 TaxID=3062780 RepID=UPI0028FC3D16|nr:hypothetical protein [Streptomyces sp. PU10]MDU0253755.1 hypothetical protein [Streptomyces sp. PU10]